jgi:Fe(3+) dicitrate transport protein
MHLKTYLLCAVICINCETYDVFAELPDQQANRLSEVVVESQGGASSVESVRPLPEVQGAKIYSGKKTSVTDLESLPEIPNNNYRQAFSQTAGLLTSEVTGEGFASVSFRGLGDPHESFNVNLLKDGLPISADMYGYPANYYQPPLDSIGSIEFVRGGAGLVYGPHAGGAINYISKKPSTEPYQAVSKQIFGQKNFYSTYNELSGTQGDVSYLGFIHHRESDGFRDENSDYGVTNGAMSAFYTPDSDSRWSFNVDIYDGSHGEAGGLTLDSGADLASYNEDRFQTVTKFDRLDIQRYAATVGYEHNFSSNTSFQGKLFGGFYNRFSKRQSPGTAAVFGGLYNGATNTIVDQEFGTIGFDGRVKHDYDFGGDKHTLTVGTTMLGVDSPFNQKLGETPFSNTGTTTKDLDRYTGATSVFVENRFVFGGLRLTPGVRIENIYQEVNENQNVGATEPLRDQSDFVSVPLFGLGASYDLGSATEVYANASQSYKPITYQDTIPLNTGDTVSGDLNPAHAVTYEVGVRGLPVEWARFDASTFLITFDDQFGRVGTNIQNVGRSRTTGMDLSVDVDTLGFLDDVTGCDGAKEFGSLRLYGNASFLNAEFTSGPVDGKTPQYAPDYLIRAGVIYDYHQKAKLALLGTFVDNLYSDDGNSANRYIPSYDVWDLTAEVPVIPDVLSVVAGVNNLFDERYYSRVRSNGIDPGLPRNAYGGITVKF